MLKNVCLAACLLAMCLFAACDEKNDPAADDTVDVDTVETDVAEEEAVDVDTVETDVAEEDTVEMDVVETDMAEEEAVEMDVVDTQEIDDDSVDNAEDDLPEDDTQEDDTVDSDTSDSDQTDSSEEQETTEDFVFRTPGSHVLQCGGEMGLEETWWDADHLCEISYDGHEIKLYIQADPTACHDIFGPTMEAVGTWAKLDGGPVQTIDGYYDWGGRHHNDWIRFRLTDSDPWWVIQHSSIGYGFRKCAPPDCLVVCQAGKTCDSGVGSPDAQIDGCERIAGDGPPPIPVICVQVGDDGVAPALLDPWTAHDGEDDYPLLPCPGDM